MKHKWIKGYFGLPLLIAMFCALMTALLTDMAGANSGGNNQSLPVKNDLLQFKAGSHVMGFKPDKAYLVNTTSFLSVEFLGAHTIIPQAVTANNANRHQNDVELTPDNEDTLADLQRVEYQNLWNGITLRYDAVQTGIAESTYFIQPGADVADIRLKYNADTELQEDGSLKIKLATQQGYITESRPVAWQVLDGRKKAIEVAYEIHDGTIGFKTGAYNKDQDLIIDPTYQWHTFYGSAAEDEGSSIAVDGNGNVYVTGHSNTSWDSPVAPQHAHTSGFDIVVLKLDSSGTYQWHTFYGSTSTDYGLGIAVYGSNHVYITGISLGTWGSPLNDHSGVVSDADIVVFKLDSSGALQWNTFYGSTTSDYGSGVAVDGNENVYVTGYSNASWGISPLHAHTVGNNEDIVVFKLDSLGALKWNTFYGSETYNDYGYGIAVDGSGNSYVTGTSKATWGSPVHPFSGNGLGDITVLKLNTSGVLQWHTFHGSTAIDNGYGIAVDGSRDIYVTGSSQATWGSPLHAYSGSYDIVALKLNNSGILQGNSFYGAASVVDFGYGLAMDGNGNVYVTGYSQATWGCPLHAYSGDHDIVVLKIFANLKKFPWPMFIPAITKGGVQ